MSNNKNASSGFYKLFNCNITVNKPKCRELHVSFIPQLSNICSNRNFNGKANIQKISHRKYLQCVLYMYTEQYFFNSTKTIKRKLINIQICFLYLKQKRRVLTTLGFFVPVAYMFLFVCFICFICAPYG